MTSFAQVIVSEARLRILRLLLKANEQPLNHEILAMGLNSMGLRMTIDQVRAELHWLAEMRTVTILTVGHMAVAEITQRGMDVAKGLSQIAGIDLYVPGSGQ